MSNDVQALRNHLGDLLRGRNAHIDIGSALKSFPPNLYGRKPPNAAHSPWQVLEHLRITLHDLLDFCTKPEYVELDWPDDYWPKSPSPPSEEAWHRSAAAIEEDLQAFEDLIKNPKSNLYAEIPWAKDHQTLLREVLLAANHTSYHTGEFVLPRRVLGTWEE